MFIATELLLKEPTLCQLRYNHNNLLSRIGLVVRHISSSHNQRDQSTERDFNHKQNHRTTSNAWLSTDLLTSDLGVDSKIQHLLAHCIWEVHHHHHQPLPSFIMTDTTYPAKNMTFYAAPRRLPRQSLLVARHSPCDRHVRCSLPREASRASWCSLAAAIGKLKGWRACQ